MSAKLYVTFESSILVVKGGYGANVASSGSNTTFARFLLHLTVTNLIVMLMLIVISGVSLVGDCTAQLRDRCFESLWQHVPMILITK